MPAPREGSLAQSSEKDRSREEMCGVVTAIEAGNLPSESPTLNFIGLDGGSARRNISAAKTLT